MRMCVTNLGCELELTLCLKLLLEFGAVFARQRGKFLRREDVMHRTGSVEICSVRDFRGS